MLEYPAHITAALDAALHGPNRIESEFLAWQEEQLARGADNTPARANDPGDAFARILDLHFNQ